MNIFFLYDNLTHNAGGCNIDKMSSHVEDYPTMHYIWTPKHTQSTIEYKVWQKFLELWHKIALWEHALLKLTPLNGFISEVSLYTQTPLSRALYIPVQLSLVNVIFIQSSQTETNVNSIIDWQTEVGSYAS